MRSAQRAVTPAAVAAARCPGYDLTQVRKAVRQCLDALPEMHNLFARASCVLLKPNLLSSKATPERPVNTHPAVVQAIAEILIHDFGCDVAIGDSCGTLSPGATAAALRNSQMTAVAAVVGARIYNVDLQPRYMVALGEGRLPIELPLPANLDQFDVIVSVAKLKTHGLTYVTGPVKNMLGLVPAGGKKHAHALATRVDEFCSLLCDLYEHLRPAAAFVDGIVGMEGRGPSNGRPRKMELVGASCDPVALDSFCAQVMGFDPMKVPLLAECEARGLGAAAPGAIVVKGEPVWTFAKPDFARPPVHVSSALLRVMPRWLSRTAVATFLSRRASINQAACTRCGECARNCPSGAILFDDKTGRYRVDPSRCIACFCCDEVCDFAAIEIHGPARRLLSRLGR